MLGEVVENIRTFVVPGGDDYTFALNFEYDSWNRIKSMTYPDGEASTVRILCWDEENRLMSVRDASNLSDYIYNAGGERVWKFSGDIQQMTLNGDQLINMANITDKTLYSSPYLVANDNNYTKHYFIENERVCSKIGGGFGSIDPINEDIIEPINGDQRSISENFNQHVIHSISCTNVEKLELNVDRVLRGIEDFIDQDADEDLQYFFVSDHLGSSSFITDVGGDAVQHLQYMPPDSYRDGEHFVNQTSTSWETPYKFSGKEKDDETGFDYFGARYYDSDVSVWLSVDPLADQRSWVSPYSYCQNNPIGKVDPTGAFDTNLEDAAGNQIEHIEDGSNAVLRQTGTGTNLHYEFNRYDESQNGTNAVNLETAVQEQQQLNESNTAID